MLPTSALGRLALAALATLLLATCQDPAGPPATLEAGRVSFSFSGRIDGTFTADGRCYWADGYAPADSACALALDLGDTVRLRAVRRPWTPGWIHMNLEFPPNGTCTDSSCRIAFELLNAVGETEQSYRSTEATVMIIDVTDDRMQGLFSGRAQRTGGAAGDTIRIFDGSLDVPVER